MHWLLPVIVLGSMVGVVVGPVYYDEYDEYNAPEPPKPYLFISGGNRRFISRIAPFLVSIRTASPTVYFGDNHFCAGVIVAKGIVATAAHCVIDSRRIVTRAKRLRVVAGTPNRLERTKNTVIFEVDTVIIHPEYIRNGPHDLALLFLKQEIPNLNWRIKIAPIVRKPVFKGQNCSTAGWGQIFHRGPYATYPVHIKLTILPPAECAEIFGKAYDSTMLCADNMDNPESAACPGDSGGPLLCDGKLAGIISWGSVCGNNFNPVLFTDAYDHRVWLREVNGAKSATNCILLVLLVLFLVLC